MIIHFEKVAQKHIDIILGWLAQDFVAAFWDNTQAHKDDIINFVEGRKTPSSYADGKYVYWIGKVDNEPLAMLMTIQETPQDDIGPEKLERLSKTGNTYGLDYMIGNPNFFGKGYGTRTLVEFIDYFRESVDPKADTFFIDPDCNNPRAKHVYMKAGFEHVCDFMMDGDCSGAGKLHHLLVKKFEPSVCKSAPQEIVIRSSTLADIEALVSMSKAKRLAYEKAQPKLWRYAGAIAEESQNKWFTKLLSHRDYIMLTAEDSNHEILGFTIGKLMPAPEVYNPGGLTLMIDDFCVKREDLWSSVGGKLIENMRQQAQDKGGTQILVVCGSHDILKRRFLISHNLSTASEWFVGDVA